MVLFDAINGKLLERTEASKGCEYYFSLPISPSKAMYAMLELFPSYTIHEHNIRMLL